jgi:rubrerythrin
MLQKPAQLLKILKDAIKVESDGYHFYQMAAERTKDSKGIQAFLELAQDELDHGSMLKGLYLAIKDRGEYQLDRKRHQRKAPKRASKDPIFSAKFKRKIKEGHFALSALRIAQLLERNSIEFYAKNAKAVGHPELKSLFRFLVAWERDHLRALARQESFLKGDF